MKVTTTNEEGVAVLRLEGEFDSFENLVVQEGFDALLAAGQPRIVLDLGTVSFLNSSTIAYFIRAQRAARERGGEVLLARPKRYILKMLTTLGLTQVFRVVETVEEGVRALKPA
jgi:anti-sigma B factor antagonist